MEPAEVESTPAAVAEVKSTSAAVAEVKSTSAAVAEVKSTSAAVAEVKSTSAAVADEAAAEEEQVEEEEEHDPQFEPVIALPPLLELLECEANEESMLQLRAKLWRMDRSEGDPEWKERGTGTVELLRHRLKPRARLLMRRDKTLKVCANHFVTSQMTLRPNCGSDRAWVWSVACDFSDEEPKPEVLAIRFANAENAKKFKEVFTVAQEIMAEWEAEMAGEGDEAPGDSTGETVESPGEQATPGTGESPEKDPQETSEEVKQELEVDQTSAAVAAQLAKLTVNEAGSAADS